MLKSLLFATSTVVLLSASALADPASEGFRLSHDELMKQAGNPAGNMANARLPTSADTTVLNIQRDKSGDVELHKTQHDVFVAQAGKATLLLGEAEGQKETAPNEMRGGTIKNPRKIELAPGDVIWIPAGLGHQLVLPAGGTFNYLAVKLNAQH